MADKVWIDELGIYITIPRSEYIPNVPYVDTSGALINAVTGAALTGHAAKPVTYCATLTDAAGSAIFSHTWMDRRTVEHPFSAVGVLLQNPTAFPVTYQCLVAVTDRYVATPVAADLLASTQKYFRLTFDGALTVTLPAASGANNEVQPFVVSDLISLSSIPRVDDAAALPLVDIWLYATANGGTTAFQVARGSEWTAGINFGGRTRAHFTCRKTSTNIIALPSEGTLPTNASSMNNVTAITNSPIAGVVTIPQYPVTGVLICGDSKFGGSLSTLPNMGASAGIRAIWALNDAGERYSYCNLSRGSWDTATYFSRLMQHLTAKDSNGNYLHSPGVVIYQAWSPNDATNSGGTVTAALCDAMWSRVQRLISFCRYRDIGLVLCTGTPRTTSAGNTASSYTAVEDDLRKWLNNSLLAISGPRLVVANVGGIVGNGASPELWANSAYTADGLHESQTAYAVQAPVIMAGVRSVN